MKTGDWILIFAVLLAAALLFLCAQPFSGAIKATVYVDGCAVTEIDLARVRDAYTIEAGGCVLQVEPGRICFLRGHCPDQTCVKEGRAGPGKPLVCLPNHVIVTVAASDGESGYDAIAK